MLKQLWQRLERPAIVKTPQQTFVVRASPYLVGLGSLLDITGGDRGSFQRRTTKGSRAADAWEALGRDWRRTTGWSTSD